MRSIVDNDRLCLVCKTPYNLYKHNVFYGDGIEEISKKYGCWCYLCARHHNMSSAGVHFNTELDRRIKEHTQKRFSEVYPDLEFIKIFGKNYL